MSHASKILAAVAATTIALTSPAFAQILNFTSPMDGLQEVPPVTTPGSGFATVTLNTITGQVEVSGTFSNLLQPVTAAHIHGLAPAGVNAGVIITLDLTGTTSGTISGGGTLTPAQIQGMIEHRTYINVHTSAFPGGEIRGQIIPAPGALAVLGMGAAFMIRRRR